MGKDRRRIRWELGTSILANRHQDLSYPNLPNYMDEWNQEYEDVIFSQRGRSLVRRPLRSALKSFTVFRDLELALDDFKADYLPISGAYQENHPGRFKFGRISMRIRLTDGSDPLEIAYRRSGFRLGSSQEKFKAGYSTELFDDLTLSLNTRYEYGSSHFAVRADLTYLLDGKTSVHLAAGDELDFLWSSNSYSLVENPLDDSTGLFFYVEHLF